MKNGKSQSRASLRTAITHSRPTKVRRYSAIQRGIPHFPNPLQKQKVHKREGCSNLCRRRRMIALWTGLLAPLKKNYESTRAFRFPWILMSTNNRIEVFVGT